MSFSAHYHLAIAYIEKSGAITTRLVNAVGALLPFIQGKSQEEMNKFKNDGKIHFEKAKIALYIYKEQIER